LLTFCNLIDELKAIKNLNEEDDPNLEEKITKRGNKLVDAGIIATVVAMALNEEKQMAILANSPQKNASS
jgi:hypothetical protein